MSIKSVEEAIRHSRRVAGEWKEVGLTEWREEHTRYAIIDPVIRALGWKTCDPKECHPEYWRYGAMEAACRVDYALFSKPCLTGIGNGEVSPDIIIEAKKLYLGLEEHVEQLQRYALAEPPMTGRAMAVAVLTNGGGWWLYDMSSRGGFPSEPVKRVDILNGNQLMAAQTLNKWLDRRRFG